MKILVVDDEDKIRNILRMYFTKEGFTVKEATSGKQALEAFNMEQFNLIILDIMMPGMDGWAVCRQIRAKSMVPIIMLTAREEEIDRILGLEMGADDYVIKPFSPRELLARVKAVSRRTSLDGDKDTIKVVNDTIYRGKYVEINPKARSVKIYDLPIILTVKEFDLLLFLAKNPGRVFTREEILEGVWDYDYQGNTRTVDTHVNRLRDKLNKVSEYSEIIHTVWGVGYKFEVLP